MSVILLSLYILLIFLEMNEHKINKGENNKEPGYQY